MAVRRSQNWTNQQRVDTPHLRSIESAVRNDFDELLKSFVLGEDQSYVIRGWELNMSGAIGGAASGLEMIVEESAMFHGKSDESGTFFVVPSGEDNQVINSTTNERVEGAFTPSALNYIGLEFTRQVDDDTASQVYLWNPTSKVEITKNLPLALTFDFKIVVSSSLFASNVLPIAIVETDANNNVISIEDRRPMLFRLGTAGSNTPDPFAEFQWDNHSEGRDENFYKSSTTTSPFRGGDKQIFTFKDNDDALKTEIKQIKGTTYWYSANPAGSITSLRSDLAHTQITGSGTISHAADFPGQMNWDADFYLDFVGSRLSYKIAANETSTDITLADNQVAYIEIVRGVDIAPKLIFTNNSNVVESVGGVSWTNDVLAEDWIKVKTANDTLYYQIASVDTASQVTLTELYQEVSTGSVGTEAQYAIGSYSTVPTPTTNRHMKVADRKDVPFDADTYWLFLRADKGSSVAKVFMRGASGGEIEQGESRQVSDNTTGQVLSYIGSPAETDTTPDFTNSITNYIPEITTLFFGPASGITTGQAFNMNSASNLNKYSFWANVNSGGGNPQIPGRVMQEVTLSGSENPTQVASAFASVISGLGYFNVVDNLDGSLVITNSQVGETDNAVNVDLAGLAITVTQEGVGKENCALVDNENLTRAAKRLDEKICEILKSLDTKPYREKMAVVSTFPATSNEIQGPVATDTVITLPLNSQDQNIQVDYEVGSKTLEVFRNGHLLCAGANADYEEVGANGDQSTQIQIKFPMDVGEDLEFAFKDSGAGGSGAGAGATGINLGPVSTADVFKQTVGNQLQFRRLTAGFGVSLIQNNNDIAVSVIPTVAPKNVVNVIADHSVQTTEDIILVTNGGSDVTITLPSSTASGKEITIKKVDVGNTINIKTISGQLLDGVDRDANPLPITVAYEAITVVSDGTSWFII